MTTNTFVQGIAKPYRKKPVIIWAVELTEDTAINTLEGTMLGRAGDFLVRGVKGEAYPVRRDIFLETYEEVRNDDKEG